MSSESDAQIQNLRAESSSGKTSTPESIQYEVGKRPRRRTIAGGDGLVSKRTAFKVVKNPVSAQSRARERPQSHKARDSALRNTPVTVEVTSNYREVDVQEPASWPDRKDGVLPGNRAVNRSGCKEPQSTAEDRVGRCGFGEAVVSLGIESFSQMTQRFANAAASTTGELRREGGPGSRQGWAQHQPARHGPKQSTERTRDKRALLRC